MKSLCAMMDPLRRISIVAFIVSEKTQQTEQTTEALTCFEKTQQQFNNRLLFLILTVTLEWRRKEEPPGFSSATQPSGVQPQEQHGSLYLLWLRNEAKTNKAAMQLRTVKFYSKNSNSSASFVFCFFFFNTAWLNRSLATSGDETPPSVATKSCAGNVKMLERDSKFQPKTPINSSAAVKWMIGACF